MMAKEKIRESVKKVSSKKSKDDLNSVNVPIPEFQDDQELESMDDVYESLQNEFDQVRKCIGMYISYLHTDAALHLMREIIHNAIDEFGNRKVPFDTIYISFDETTQTFTVKDGGRGIPFAKLKEVCTKKHVSTKYERSEIMKRFAGRNGKTNAVFKLI